MISRTQSICLVLLALADVAFGAASAWFLPDRVPVHWNFRGEADRYGSPWELAFLMPGIIALSVGLLVVLPKLGSAGAQLERSGNAYGRMTIAIVAAMIGIHLLVVVRGAHPFDVVSAMVAAVGLLIAAVGNWAGKIRRNPIAGFRTPWTLKSDEVWDRTNRLGGRLQFALGILVAVAALCLPVWIALAALMGGLFMLVLWGFVYSWSLSRQAS
jgi:uncharacterized membrane protein